jgi:hypothetical protein
VTGGLIEQHTLATAFTVIHVSIDLDHLRRLELSVTERTK